MFDKVLSHYSIFSPIYLSRKLQEQKYNPEAFINWYTSFPDISDLKYRPNKLSKKAFYLALAGYYFWFCYVISALYVFTFSQIFGLIGLFVSPFLVGGIMYTIVYVATFLHPKKPKEEQLGKKSGKKSARKKHHK